MYTYVAENQFVGGDICYFAGYGICLSSVEYTRLQHMPTHSLTRRLSRRRILLCTSSCGSLCGPCMDSWRVSLVLASGLSV
jgi:hypothetical protein